MVVNTSHPFVAWNAAILREFFSPAQRDERVVLALGRAELDDLSPELGGYEGLIEAVRQGAPWVQLTGNSGLPDMASKLRTHRTMANRPPGYVDPAQLLAYADASDRMPSYLPILAVLIAIYDESRGGAGFHETVKRVLSPRWVVGQLGDVNDALFGDLEQWTGPNGTKGRFGVFRRTKLGGQPHLGELVAQTIFRSTDAERLSYVFARAGVAPGQRLAPEQKNEVLAGIQNADARLSRGLRDAAAKADYRELVLEQIEAILGDWDGQQLHRSEAFERELGLCLQLADSRLPWRVAWRLRSTLKEGDLRLQHGQYEWQAVMGGDPDVTASLVTGSGAGDLLEKARADANERISIKRVGGSHSAGEFYFRHRVIRYLECRGDDFVERESLPNHGGGYILSGPGNDLLGPFLHSRGVHPQESPTHGLPAKWKLWWVADCSRLVGLSIPGETEIRPRTSVLRLVGGVRVRRGGRVLFLHHDLPSLELDAPPGTSLNAHDGLVLTENSTALPTRDFQLTSVRRFSIDPRESRTQHFVIQARSASGQLLGSTTLRLATPDAVLGAGGRIGLDRWGGSTTDAPVLVGMFLDPGRAVRTERTIDQFAVDELCTSITPNEMAARIKNNPIARFLDSLAMADATRTSYGAARDRLRDYLGRDGRYESVSSIMRDLRGRGYVEIVTDARGRWAAVAKVPPTVWKLPLKFNKSSVWAVGGTLALRQWGELVSTDGACWFVTNGFARVPTLRLVGEPNSAQGLGYRVIENPGVAMAEFSASLAEVRALLSDRKAEQLDARAGDLETFILHNGWQPGDRLRQVEWSLLRYLEPETRAQKVRVLRNRVGDGFRYRFMRDERWGTWIAYAAFIEWLDTCLDVHGIAPWPISYDPERRVVWLPERMNLPYVLERALIAASGEAPSVQVLTRAPDGSDQLFALTSFGTRVGPFDRCYGDLFESGATANWLTYRWVPKILIETVAGKLGCRVVSIRSAYTTEGLR
jgi:hypothetical protein